ncbi:MAG: recombination regulator RecX [Endomicrobium sp.]|jgi:regulatory protein|nr:recombination regulator RecX [Endomicrobium sp.]
MQINKIEKIRNRKDIFKVFFDSGENILISADSIVKFGLKEGADLTDEELKRISSFDKSGRACADALALVGKRSYSSKSLYDKLIQKGYDSKDAKAAVGRLKELNYINDEKFTKIYAQYLKNRGKGEYAIRAELEKHAIDKNTINETLELLKSEEEPHEQIIAIIKNKFKKFDYKNKNEVRKTAAFFLRRGFSSQTIAKALREYKGINLEDDI